MKTGAASLRKYLLEITLLLQTRCVGNMIGCQLFPFFPLVKKDHLLVCIIPNLSTLFEARHYKCIGKYELNTKA